MQAQTKQKPTKTKQIKILFVSLHRKSLNIQISQVMTHQYINGLKGQQALSPGRRPGYKSDEDTRPESAKALFSCYPGFGLCAFALTGRESHHVQIPKAMPLAMCLMPLQGTFAISET